MFDLEPTEKCELVTVEDDAEFRTFLDRKPRGIAMIAEHYGQVDQLVIHADAGDFAKWLMVQHPEVQVEVQAAHRLVLRSGDWWIPLVFLASDVTLPVFLNIVSSYLFEKMKGALRGDKHRVHLSAEFQDPSTGLVKRFNFEGDPNALQDAVKKLDLDKFFHG